MSRRPAVILIVLLLATGLSGCLDLQAAEVPSRLLEGPGGNGWERNDDHSQDEATSANFGLTKVQTLSYQDRSTRGDGYPGWLQVTTLRTVFTPSGESLRDRLSDRLREASEGKGIRLDGEPVEGDREVAGGAESLFIVYNGSVTDSDSAGNLFTRDARVKILGEVWQCRAERTSVIVIALAQVTSGRSVGQIPISSSSQATTWQEVVEDPYGSIEDVRGDRGLAHNVRCG